MAGNPGWAILLLWLAMLLLGPLVGIIWAVTLAFRQFSIKELFALTAFWAAIICFWVLSYYRVVAITGPSQ